MASNVRTRSSYLEDDLNLPLNPTASTSATPIIEQDSDSNPSTDTRPHRSDAPILDPSFYPQGSRSLSSTALQAFTLGITLSTSLIATLYLFTISNPTWRLPAFISTLCIFHFLEYYTTARWNTPQAKLSSYLLFSNGMAYTIAHLTAMVEITTTSLLLPQWQASLNPPSVQLLGLFLVVVGQAVRSTAMAQAGTNFAHIPAREKKQGHVLVTWGVYAYFRHPSYFGFFWWAVGTQILVGNKICALGYTVVLWQFFRKRIHAEEGFLVSFFGEDYVEFKKRTGTGIPFIR